MATPARSVQFRNIEDVMEAYSNAEIPAFAIWQGRQLMFPFDVESVEEGTNLLGELLPKLQDSAAIYTLCTYKDVGDKGILSNTPFSSSFNFQLRRLRDEQGHYLQPAVGGVSENAILSELKALRMDNQSLREKLEALEEEEEEEEGLGLVGKLLENPVIAGIVKNFATSLTAKTGMGSDAGAYKNVSMGAIDDDARLSIAVEELKQCDPLLVNHLEKLAKIAKADPASFKLFLGYLDGLE